MNNESSNIEALTKGIALLSTVYIAGGLFIYLGITFASTFSLILGLVLTIGPTILIVRIVRRGKQHEKRKEVAMKYTSFQDGTLTLHARTPDNAAIICCESIEMNALVYHNATVEVNAATVGGVTVGGAHVNPAYYSVSHGGKSGKSKLIYTGKETNQQIKEIELAPHLVPLAKQHPVISHLMCGNSILCTRTVDSTTSIVASKYYASGDKAKMHMAYIQELLASSLTDSQCEAIREWCAGKN